MDFSALEPLADAVLYEGYQLYPYRRAALKNQQRWNFGSLYPEAFARAAAASDAWRNQTECLATAAATGTSPDARLEAGSAAPGETRMEVRIGAQLRFLQMSTEGGGDTVRSLSLGPYELDALRGGPQVNAGADWGLAIHCRWTANPVPGGGAAGASAWKIRLEVANRAPASPGGGRDAALAQTLVSAQVLLGIEGGEFLSLFNPAPEWRQAAASCQSAGLYPVLAGEGPGRRSPWILSAPIALYDFPRLAAESPGEFFDSTEVDELLALRIQTLTSEEKEAMRADPRTRAMLERVEALPASGWDRLHGRTQLAAGPRRAEGRDGI
ncbi:MAG: hypothetical protein ACRD17_11125 [Terriglobales bacterium]